MPAPNFASVGLLLVVMGLGTRVSDTLRSPLDHLQPTNPSGPSGLLCF